ncbi:hypothetical protein TSOC_004290 [Tetrabaena socialis]|uniref:Uncharacterized protein n=1 Tax=Tetrabaena socialis TaxID=47790 RepID=A0A2J8A9F2_9CHLO|nr:hypothetical protein TSOC_004290 [Tetrabaena socialis]|eukprot:PNH09125.1 hypothetical protein TSOC_004290 [Tetrabaena socialis]
MGCGASVAKVPSAAGLDPGELRDRSLQPTVVFHAGVAQAGARGTAAPPPPQQQQQEQGPPGEAPQPGGRSEPPAAAASAVRPAGAAEPAAQGHAAAEAIGATAGPPKPAAELESAAAAAAAAAPPAPQPPAATSPAEAAAAPSAPSAAAAGAAAATASAAAPVAGPQPRMRDCAVSLSFLIRFCRRQEEAVAEMRAALAVHGRLLGGKDPAMRNTMQTLADMLDDRAEAEQLHKRAVALVEKVYGPTHMDVGLGLISYGSFLMGWPEGEGGGSRMAEGQALVTRGTDIHMKVGASGRGRVKARACCTGASKDLRLQLVDASYGISCAQLGPNHPSALDALAEKAELAAMGGDMAAGVALFRQLAVGLSGGRDLLDPPEPPSSGSGPASGAPSGGEDLSAKAVDAWFRVATYSSGGGAAAEERAIAVCRALVPQKRRQHLRRLRAAAASGGEFAEAAAAALAALQPPATTAPGGAASTDAGADPAGLWDPDDPRVDFASNIAELHTWATALGKLGRMEEAVRLQWRLADVVRGSKEMRDTEMQLPSGKVYGPTHMDVGLGLISYGSFLMGWPEGEGGGSRMAEGQALVTRGTDIHMKFQAQQMEAARAH